MTNYYYDTYFSLHTRGKVAENNDASHSVTLRKEFILFKYRFIYTTSATLNKVLGVY